MTRPLNLDEILLLLEGSPRLRWVPTWLVRRIVTAVYIECSSYRSAD